MKSPGFLAASVLSLALAIGASVAAFSVIDAIRFRALPFPDAARLVVIGEMPATADEARTHTCEQNCSTSYTTYDGLLRAYEFKSLDKVAAFTSGAKALNVTTNVQCQSQS